MSRSYTSGIGYGSKRLQLGATTKAPSAAKGRPRKKAKPESEPVQAIATLLKPMLERTLKPLPKPKPPVLPPMPEVRPIDRAAVLKWLEVKSGGGSNGGGIFHPATDAQGYRPWADGRMVGSALMMLARWLPCPLHMVGYTPNEDQLEFDRTVAQNQILHAVEGLTKRLQDSMKPETLSHLLSVYPGENPGLHSVTWSRITRYGPQFYDWLEFCKVRGTGTNPLLHIRRTYPTSIQRKHWLQLSLIDPLLQAVAKEPVRFRTLLYLLSNGLRRHEVVRLKIEDLLLERSEVRVYGKGSAHGPSGSRMRIVPLLPWTRKALDRWLVVRAKKDRSAWVFPRKMDPQVHITSQWLQTMLRQYINRCYPGREDMKKITPHTLRLWFVTRSYYHQVPTDQIMAATGHASLASMQTYLVTNPDQTRESYSNATQERWF
jgi:integrase